MYDILKSYTLEELKKEIKKTNITGYSKLKKADLIELMLKHEERFKHLKKKVSKHQLNAIKRREMKKNLFKDINRIEVK